MRQASLLLVDDNDVFAHVLGDALCRQGFAVRHAPGFDEAMRQIAQYPPECALVDLNLGGTSGLRLIRPLKDAHRDCRVVVLTGYASVATAVDAIKLGADEYLAKPAAMSNIVRALGRDSGSGARPGEARELSVQRLEWEHIQQVLAEHGGNIAATARALHMYRRTLQRKLARRSPD